MSMECIYDFLFEYDDSDIKPDAIVVELNYIDSGKIIILQDLSKLSYLFACLVRIDFETESYDKDTYISEIINENMAFQPTQSGDHDDIIIEYFDWQRKRIGNAGDDFEKLSDILDDFGTTLQVGKFCYLAEYVKSSDFEDWLMDNLEDDDNYLQDDNFDTDSLFKSSEYKERIAFTINDVNEIFDI